MLPIGWILFIVSNAIVISLVVFCFYRVFTIPKEHMHAPLDIDTHDMEEVQENGDNEEISMPGDPSKDA
ncbi:MAG: hypothetical protein JXR73_11875 [Candidatus Omnitrophica bacterium]|nr:hypothetical protein [Candidatus Omnitrophota bacterium]